MPRARLSGAMERKPVAAFYCVYLLRCVTPGSKKSAYIGSTPHPQRRLRQHNGDLSSRSSRRTFNLRPSEMAMMVTGFPTREAATIFEWAWQHPGYTRHNTEAERLAHRPRPKPGNKHPKEVAKPMPERIRQLLPLLQSKSFRQMPLRVRIFSQAAHTQWKSSTAAHPVSTPVDVTILDRKYVMEGTAGIEVTYKPMRDQIVKSTTRLATGKRLPCAICHQALDASADLVAVCANNPGCSTVSHLSCLARHFGRNSNVESVLLPLSGTCPGCGTRTAWSDIARDVSLRAHGKLEVAKLLKPPRGSKMSDDEGPDVASESELSDTSESGPEPSPDKKRRPAALKSKTVPAPTSLPPTPPAVSKAAVWRPTKPVVIPNSEDSDYDDIEEVTRSKFFPA